MSIVYTVVESSDEPWSGSGSPVLKIARIDGEVFLSIGDALDGAADFPDAASGVDSQGVSGVAGIAVSTNDLLTALLSVGALDELVGGHGV